MKITYPLTVDNETKNKTERFFDLVEDYLPGQKDDGELL